MTFRAIDLTGFTPAVLRAQPEPEMQWVPVADLVIDGRYQRDLTGPGRRHIQRIADGFDWTRFGALDVAATEDGRFAVVDGQHRAYAAALVGLDRVPCMVTPMTPVQQAAAFHAINSAKVRLDRAATFRAQVMAGDPVAMRADAAVRAAGCEMPGYNPTAHLRKPGQVFTHTLIRRMVADGLDEVVTLGLRAIKDSAAGQEDFAGGMGAGVRVWDQVVLAVWLPVLATNQQFLRLPLSQVFDSIPWLEWIETARHDARMAPAGGSARARLTGQVQGVLRRALADQRAKAIMGGVAA